MRSRNETRGVEGSAPGVPTGQDQQSFTPWHPSVTKLGRTVCVKGDLIGAEDLTIDGRVEGRIDLPDHTLTVLPNATLEADIAAKAVVVFGSVIGSVTAHDKLEIRGSGSIDGQVACVRLVIHEGGRLQGKVDMATLADASEAAQSSDASARFAAAV
jgi:cytoskeletal protein CcmA (bactofilin family)